MIRRIAISGAVLLLALSARAQLVVVTSTWGTVSDPSAPVSINVTPAPRLSVWVQDALAAPMDLTGWTGSWSVVAADGVAVQTGGFLAASTVVSSGVFRFQGSTLPVGSYDVQAWAATTSDAVRIYWSRWSVTSAPSFAQTIITTVSVAGVDLVITNNIEIGNVAVSNVIVISNTVINQITTAPLISNSVVFSTGVTALQSRVGGFAFASSNGSIQLRVLTNSADNYTIDLSAILQGSTFPISAIGTNRWKASGDVAITNYLALPAAATNIQSWLWGSGGGCAFGSCGEAVWVESKPGAIPPGSTLMAITGLGGQCITNSVLQTTNYVQTTSAPNGGGRGLHRGVSAATVVGGGGSYAALYLLTPTSNVLLAVAAGGPGAGNTLAAGGGGGGTGAASAGGFSGAAATDANAGAPATATPGWSVLVSATSGSVFQAGDAGAHTGTTVAAVGGASAGYYGAGGGMAGTANNAHAGGSSGVGYINTDYMTGIRIRASPGISGVAPPLSTIPEYYPGAGQNSASTHNAIGGSAAICVGY